MKRRIAAVVVTAGCLAIGLPGNVFGQGKGKPPAPTNVHVTSQLLDANAYGPFELRSDGLGPYVSGAGVVSQIYASGGDWELNLSQQSDRIVDLTLTRADGAPSPVPGGRYPARLISRCFSPDGVTGYLQIQPGSSNPRCAMRVNFTVGGVAHSLVMSPLYAGTTWVTVSCVADTDSNGTCDRWSAAPDPNVDRPVAQLIRMDRPKETLVGTYLLNFSLTVTR